MRANSPDVYPDDEVTPEIGDGLSDLEAIVTALRNGPSATASRL